ncbi:hypothetical protein GGR56DRAFT_424213 [Xylariaceae sp. FL0804]|nr:hypothetical protein GGR56DRAFT_424213 [Xylariaceae sp. FL0804]
MSHEMGSNLIALTGRVMSSPHSSPREHTRVVCVIGVKHETPPQGHDVPTPSARRWQLSHRVRRCSPELPSELQSVEGVVSLTSVPQRVPFLAVPASPLRSASEPGARQSRRRRSSAATAPHIAFSRGTVRCRNGHTHCSTQQEPAVNNRSFLRTGGLSSLWPQLRHSFVHPQAAFLFLLCPRWVLRPPKPGSARRGKRTDQLRRAGLAATNNGVARVPLGGWVIWPARWGDVPSGRCLAFACAFAFAFAAAFAAAAAAAGAPAGLEGKATRRGKGKCGCDFGLSCIRPRLLRLVVT